MGGNVVSGFLPMFIYIGVVVILGVAMLIGSTILGRIIGQRYPTSEKESTYECGMMPFKDARHRFDVRFYLVAMLFILFDIEVIFLYPWAVVLRDLRVFALIPISFFMILLVVGLVYEWKKGALDWQ